MIATFSFDDVQYVSDNILAKKKFDKSVIIRKSYPYLSTLLAHTDIIPDLCNIIMEYTDEMFIFQIKGVSENGCNVLSDRYFILFSDKYQLTKLLDYKKSVIEIEKIKEGHITALLYLDSIYNMNETNYEMETEFRRDNFHVKIKNLDEYNDILAICKLFRDLYVSPQFVKK